MNRVAEALADIGAIRKQLTFVAAYIRTAAIMRRIIVNVVLDTIRIVEYSKKSQ